MLKQQQGQQHIMAMTTMWQIKQTRTRVKSTDILPQHKPKPKHVRSHQQ